MSIWEILLIGVALSMDAFAVGVTNGMTEPNMRIVKIFAVAGTFGAFQFAMPCLGYYCSEAFSALIGKIAPWLSCALLAFIGGKMIFDSCREPHESGRRLLRFVSAGKSLGAVKLLLQGVATSLDALVVGVTLLAAEMSGGLPVHVTLCALLIGETTFSISLAAVQIGKTTGDRLAGRTGILGGIILILIGLKILLEGIL